MQKWYKKYVPIADDLYKQHLNSLKKKENLFMSKPFKHLQQEIVNLLEKPAAKKTQRIFKRNAASRIQTKHYT